MNVLAILKFLAFRINREAGMVKIFYVPVVLFTYYVVSTLIVLATVETYGMTLVNIALIISGVITYAILCLWMFIDFIKKKDLKYKILWGMMFAIFNILTVFVYLFMVYLPYKKKQHLGKLGFEK